jgi:hypothetical protein
MALPPVALVQEATTHGARGLLPTVRVGVNNHQVVGRAKIKGADQRLLR